MRASNELLARNRKRAVISDSPLMTLVGVQGFEPWTPWSQTRCATGLRHTPKTKIIQAVSTSVKGQVKLCVNYLRAALEAMYFSKRLKYATLGLQVFPIRHEGDDGNGFQY